MAELNSKHDNSMTGRCGLYEASVLGPAQHAMPGRPQALALQAPPPKVWHACLCRDRRFAEKAAPDAPQTPAMRDGAPPATSPLPPGPLPPAPPPIIAASPLENGLAGSPADGLMQAGEKMVVRPCLVLW